MKSEDVNWIYVGVTKDTGALGFTQDLKKANSNFEQPFSAYIHKDDHNAKIDALSLKLAEAEAKVSELEKYVARCDETNCFKMSEKITKLEQQLKKADKALREYSKHRLTHYEDCSYYSGETDSDDECCDCGIYESDIKIQAVHHEIIKYLKSRGEK